MDFLSILKTAGGIIIAIFALLFMITVHEAGHYAVGKLLKFKINEFSIGFGKAIFKRKLKSGELFSIRLLPLGGYCAFEGEDEYEDEKSSKKQPFIEEDEKEINVENDGSFNKQKPWKRILTLVAGAFFNFVSAILLIALTFTFYGDVLPCTEINSAYVNEYVSKDSVFKDGDIILSVDNEHFSFFSTNFASNWSKGEHTAVVRRIGDDGKRYQTTVKFDGKDYGFVDSSSLEMYAYYRHKNGEETLGFTEFDEKIYQSYTEEQLKQNHDAVQKIIDKGNCITYKFYRVRFGFFDAFARGFLSAFRMVWLVISSFIGIFTGATPLAELGGPITVISTLGQSATLNLGVLMYFVCLISANLAVFNLLPIPSLDGSRVVFVLIEWIIGRPVSRKFEAIVHSVGLIIIFAFAIMIDVMKWF